MSLQVRSFPGSDSEKSLLIMRLPIVCSFVRFFPPSITGQKTSIDADAIHIARPMENAKLISETKLVNEQIRGAGAGMQSNCVAQAVAVSAPGN